MASAEQGVGLGTAAVVTPWRVLYVLGKAGVFTLAFRQGRTACHGLRPHSSCARQWPLLRSSSLLSKRELVCSSALGTSVSRDHCQWCSLLLTLQTHGPSCSSGVSEGRSPDVGRVGAEGLMLQPIRCLGILQRMSISVQNTS